VAEQSLPDDLEGIGDFWLADHERAAVMRYDAAGRYLGFDPAPDSDICLYRTAAEAAWWASISFESYMASHQVGRRVA
jgi:hypothetical protein